MRRIGVHTSIAGGLHSSLERAHALGCNTLQIFSHNPRGWKVKAIPEEEIDRFRTYRLQFDLSPVYIHTSYLINMASRDEMLRRKSIDLLIIEMDRADALGADYVVIHTGSASGEDERNSRKRAIGALNEAAKMKRWQSGLLLENTAGERGDISSSIRDLSEIMSGVTGTLISGACIDTCHAFAAGYDIRSNEGVREISDEIGKYIGHHKIKLIHMNDSKGKGGSRVDRHEHIGRGKIGVNGLSRFINHQLFKDIPLILETPKKKETDDPRNLARVRKMTGSK